MIKWIKSLAVIDRVWVFNVGDLYPNQGDLSQVYREHAPSENWIDFIYLPNRSSALVLTEI